MTQCAAKNFMKANLFSLAPQFQVGEVGARFGPSLMPSGDPYAWTRIEPVWRAIAAKVDPYNWPSNRAF